VRRSGRIAKEIPIVLIGTDETGRVFAEQSTTVVLSRHGAGILSHHTFAPEETLTLRFGEPSREADVRLVGRMGETERGYIYGVEFLDPDVDYWRMTFPPPEEYSGTAAIWLECTLCLGRQKVEPSEIETDVFLTTANIFRFCARCGQTTPWRKAVEGQAPTQLSVQPDRAPSAGSAAEAEGEKPSAPKSSTAGAVTAVLELVPAGGMAAQELATPAKRRENRRKHIRTRVSFRACVRYRGLEEEMVECENISKGGLCFRSRKRYPEDAQIDVAAPYEPGAPAIFVSAQIRHIEKMPEGGLFRYGVAYVKS
jgi:PilZ domain